MYKKFIIENHDGSGSFAILLICFNPKAGLEAGSLKYYSIFGEIPEIHEVSEIYEGYLAIAEKFVEKAKEICKKENAILLKY